MEYRPGSIEPKWRQWWKENHTYKTKTDQSKPKFYILDMFPYPSGAGLHVGHPLGYIASDVLARYKRLCGFNVLHPMGYDSFGLPAEQYAIQTGIHPAVSTETNIDRYRQQLENLGFSYDWDREVRTSNPDFYKWTQWIFMQLFNHYYDLKEQKSKPISGLVEQFSASGNTNINAVCDEETPMFSASDWNTMSEEAQQIMLLKYRLTYPGEEYVNWCAGLGSVLSNDEVKDGVSERGGHPVERKLMKQWMMRITAYSDRLLDGLNEIEWPESLKEQQRNFIGKSTGASVRFDVDQYPDHQIEVFTTRVDTIYGATFLVLAPEHELVKTITTPDQNIEINGYIKWATSRSEIERMSESKKVTGAFTGAYAINPFNNEKIPIWIADYVLAGYGTGAVMAVPSGDQRDWNFATQFSLPIVPILNAQKDISVQADPTKDGRYINSGIINGCTYQEALPILVDWLVKNNRGRAKTQYRQRNAVFARQRYWGEPVPIYWEGNIPRLVDESDLPIVLPPVDKYLPTETGEPPLARAENWTYKGYPLEYSTMPGWAGSSWYFYRYMDPHNAESFAAKEAIDYWQQVDFYLGGAEHATGHLLYSRFWNHFLYDLGLVPHREFAKKLLNQGMIQGVSSFVYRAKEQFFEAYLLLKVLNPFFAEMGPIEIDEPGYEEGYKYDFAFASNDLVIEVTSYKQAEKIDRIRTTALADGKRLMVIYTESMMDHINTPETIASWIKQGLESRETYIIAQEKSDSANLFVSANLLYKYDINAFTKLHTDVYLVENSHLQIEKATLATQFKNGKFKLDPSGHFICTHEVEKMSKSKFNVVNPDDVIAEFGTDCFRMFEMFLGPITDAKPWNTQGISGVSGFLKRFWSLFYTSSGKFELTVEAPTREELRILHTCIKKVTEDIERMSMNTCISHFMVATNDLRKIDCRKRQILEPLVVLIAPFGPHISEELWQLAGYKTTVCDAQWPSWNPEHLKTDTINYPIQINGKLRGTIELPADVAAADAESSALSMDQIQKWMEGKPPKKVVFVPGRMINIVV